MLHFLTSLPSPLKGERQFDFLVLTGDYSSTYVRVLQYFRESTGKNRFTHVDGAQEIYYQLQEYVDEI